jgi:hypothetical protein
MVVINKVFREIQETWITPKKKFQENQKHVNYGL